MDLKSEFLAGFKEGWEGFWSPFKGLYESLSATWHRHHNAEVEQSPN